MSPFKGNNGNDNPNNNEKNVKQWINLLRKLFSILGRKIKTLVKACEKPVKLRFVTIEDITEFSAYEDSKQFVNFLKDEKIYESIFNGWDAKFKCIAHLLCSFIGLPFSPKKGDLDLNCRRIVWFLDNVRLNFDVNCRSLFALLFCSFPYLIEMFDLQKDNKKQFKSLATAFGLKISKMSIKEKRQAVSDTFCQKVQKHVQGLKVAPDSIPRVDTSHMKCLIEVFKACLLDNTFPTLKRDMDNEIITIQFDHEKVFDADDILKWFQSIWSNYACDIFPGIKGLDTCSGRVERNTRALEWFIDKLLLPKKQKKNDEDDEKKRAKLIQKLLEFCSLIRSNHKNKIDILNILKSCIEEALSDAAINDFRRAMKVSKDVPVGDAFVEKYQEIANRIKESKAKDEGKSKKSPKNDKQSKKEKDEGESKKSKAKKQKPAAKKSSKKEAKANDKEKSNNSDSKKRKRNDDDSKSSKKRRKN